MGKGDVWLLEGMADREDLYHLLSLTLSHIPCCLSETQQYELVGLMRSPGNRFFMFLTHPTSSWSGSCASTVFSSLVDSKSAWTILLGRSPHEVGWVGEVQEKHEWLMWISGVCLRNILSKVTKGEPRYLNLIPILGFVSSAVALGSCKSQLNAMVAQSFWLLQPSKSLRNTNPSD